METTIVVTVGLSDANGRPVEGLDTETVRRELAPLFSALFTVAEGVGEYTNDAGETFAERSAVLVGLTQHSRAAIAEALSWAGAEWQQECIGLVWNSTGSDSLVRSRLLVAES